MAISQEDLLSILRDEKRRALGFDGDDTSSELQSNRETALNYYKGDVSNDIPSLENRSTAVSSDVADAVEQVLPQLVEIFLEEDVLSFRPNSEEDIAAAEQETDFVNHVIFEQNDGFGNLNTAFKDALLLKTGVFMWQWEEGEEKEEVLEGLGELDMQNITATVPEDEIVGIEAVKKTELRIDEVSGQQQPIEETAYNVTIRKKCEGRVVISAWAPDDVAVSEDTRKLGDGTYCGFRTRVRRQELLADGYDEDLVADLPRYGGGYGDPVNTARDFAGEEYERTGGSSINGLDMVQIIHNFIRIYEDNQMKLYRVVTGGEQMDVVLKVEEVESVPAASVCPFPNPHRFYGQSLADKLVEIQRIKTALIRMGLDSGYYAMNQRMEVAESGVTKHTLSDILNNTPGAPIRVKTANTVTPVASGSMNFDVLSMIEHVNTMSEQRSGVSRASMGLTPDTLHETKGGMLAIMNAGQIRVRYIGRIFAETGFKDLCLGVHDTLRKNATMDQIVRLRGKWVPVNPSSWSNREDMSVEIGNAGGREWDMQVLAKVIEMQERAVEMQGGNAGPYVTPKHMLTAAHKMVSRMGFSQPELFFTDPGQAEQIAAQEVQKPAEPNPEMQKVQMQMQLEQMKAQNDLQITQQRHQADIQIKQQELQSKASIEAAKAEKDFALKREQTQMDHQAKLEMMRAELQLKREQLQAELELKFKVEEAEATLKQQELAHRVSMDTSLNSSVDQPHPGGEPGA